MTTVSQISLINEMLNYSIDIYDNKNKSDFFFSEPITDLQVGIYLDNVNKRITVAFRGTESLRDAFTDLNVKKVNYNDTIRVHKGFYNQLFNSSIYEEFCCRLNLLILENEDYSIYVTGHSLGAALSSLFTFKLSECYSKRINNINFASPRVGNYYWKKAFDNKENISHLRVIVSSDPIPITPFFNYWHIKNSLRLNSKKLIYLVSTHKTKVYSRLIKHLEIDYLYKDK